MSASSLLDERLRHCTQLWLQVCRARGTPAPQGSVSAFLAQLPPQEQTELEHALLLCLNGREKRRELALLSWAAACTRPEFLDRLHTHGLACTGPALFGTGLTLMAAGWDMSARIAQLASHPEDLALLRSRLMPHAPPSPPAAPAPSDAAPVSLPESASPPSLSPIVVPVPPTPASLSLSTQAPTAWPAPAARSAAVPVPARPAAPAPPPPADATLEPRPAPRPKAPSKPLAQPGLSRQLTSLLVSASAAMPVLTPQARSEARSAPLTPTLAQMPALKAAPSPAQAPASARAENASAAAVTAVTATRTPDMPTLADATPSGQVRLLGPEAAHILDISVHRHSASFMGAQGVCIISAHALPAGGYDWRHPLQVQLAPQDMPLAIAVLIKLSTSARFSTEGSAPESFAQLQRQASGLRLLTGQGSVVYAVPIDSGTQCFLLNLFCQAMAAGLSGSSVADVLALVRASHG